MPFGLAVESHSLARSDRADRGVRQEPSWLSKSDSAYVALDSSTPMTQPNGSKIARFHECAIRVHIICSTPCMKDLLRVQHVHPVMKCFPIFRTHALSHHADCPSSKPSSSRQSMITSSSPRAPFSCPSRGALGVRGDRSSWNCEIVSGWICEGFTSSCSADNDGSLAILAGFLGLSQRPPRKSLATHSSLGSIEMSGA